MTRFVHQKIALGTGWCMDVGDKYIGDKEPNQNNGTRDGMKRIDRRQWILKY